MALVCPHPDPALDGVSDYSWRLAEALRGHGLLADVVPAADLGARLPARWATEREYDAVHVQYAPAVFSAAPDIGRLPWRLPRHTRLLTTLHEYGAFTPRPRLAPLARPLERLGRWDRETALLVPRSDAVLVSTAEHAALVRRRFAGRVLPHAVPIPPNVPPEPVGQVAAAAVRDRLRLPANTPLLVFFGFVHPVKGLRHLLAALARLHAGADRPAPHLVVAGGSTSAVLPQDEADAVLRELREEAATSGVGDTVTWTGYLPAAEASELLAAADVVVLPFTAGTTTKSGALAAAHAHGAPVVATVADPPDPAVVGDRDAVLVPPRDPPALAAAISRVLSDAGLAERLRESGRRSAAPRSWPRVAAAHADLYRALGVLPAAVEPR